jgi:ATP-binding cassette subfamily F protein uup
VISYLEDFLFSPARARSPVKVLSGGERNRLLLAKMFTTPGNVLVMDEPTNDLDLETLELLEAMLVEYGGTLLLVSHDRDFLNNVVTSTLAWEGEGKWKEYPGGYDDWLSQRLQSAVPETGGAGASPARRRSPLNGKEKREWEALPAKIEALEAEQEALAARIASAEFFQQPRESQQTVLERNGKIPTEMEKLFQRWAELEARLND